MSNCLQKYEQITKVAKARTELSKKKSETHTSSTIVLFLDFTVTASYRCIRKSVIITTLGQIFLLVDLQDFCFQI